MRPTVTSFNGYIFSAGEAAFPEQGFFPQAGSQSVELARSDNAPVISQVKRQSKITKLRIYPTGTFTSQVNVYHGYFDTYDKSTRRLVVTDENSVQWYVMAKVEGEPHSYTDYLEFTLRVPDSVWKLVTPLSDTWNITASGQTHTFTTTGNRSVYPIMSIVPTGTRAGGGHRYSEFRAWYNPSTTLGFKDECIDIVNKAWSTTGIVASTTVSNQINQGGGIGTGLTPFPVDTAVGGGLAASGLLTVDNEQMTYTLSGSTLTPTARGVGGTTAATHADNAVLKQAQSFKDGSDLRVRLLGDGASEEMPYWLNGYNTATSQVWGVVDFDPGITLTLSGAITNVATVTTLNFKQTAANKAFLTDLSKKNNFCFAIGSELFDFNKDTVVDISNWKITTTKTDARAAYKSTKAAHSDGDNVYWIQYVFQLCYGDFTLSAPVQDESQKPIIDLTSTNTSFVWGTNFTDTSGVRGASWKALRRKSPGRKSRTYTGEHALGADTTPDATIDDPSTCLGCWVSSYQDGTTWRGESAINQWVMYNSAGWTTFTIVDAVYRYSADFPAFMGLQKSLDGVNWSNCTGFPEAKPAGSKSWTAGAAHSAVSLGGTFRWLRWIADGAIAGNIPNNVAAIEATSITLARNSSNVMQLVYTSAQQATTYHIKATITNVGTGDAISLDFVMLLNDTLEVDCLNKNITHIENNGNAIGAISYNSKRNYWITVEPVTANGGVASGATFRYDDGGTGNVTITSSLTDRMA